MPEHKFQPTITVDELRTRNVVSTAEAITRQAAEEPQPGSQSQDTTSQGQH